MYKSVRQVYPSKINAIDEIVTKNDIQRGKRSERDINKSFLSNVK